METAPLLALAILLAIGGTIVVGFCLALFLRRLSWARVVGLTMVLVGVAAASGLLFAIGYFGESIDFNPPHVRDQDVANMWVSTGLLAPHQAVTLRADGTFSLTAGEDVSGRWTRSDWNLTMWPSGREAESWRVVLVNGSYRLLRHYCGIEDTCGKRQVTFRRN